LEALPGPRREALQGRGDRRQVLRFLPGQVPGRREQQPVPRQDDGSREVPYARGEVVEQPLAISPARALVPSHYPSSPLSGPHPPLSGAHPPPLLPSGSPGSAASPLAVS